MTAFIIILVAIMVIMFLPMKKKEEKTIQEEKSSKPPNLKIISSKDAMYGAPEGMKRTYKNGESLTDDECDFVQARLRLDLPCCPDCESGHFLEGPSGGGSINVKCSNKQCSSKFNIMWPLGIDRISDASPDKSRDMVSFGPNR